MDGSTLRRLTLTVLVPAWVAAAVGCGGSEPVCPTDDGVLAEGSSVTCVEVHQGRHYVELLAARPLTEAQQDRFVQALAGQARDDVDAVHAVLAAAAARSAALEQATGLQAAADRSHETFDATQGGGVFPAARWPVVADVVADAVDVWERDEPSRLVLTEMDVEGWIRYVSLCREAQGGGPLMVSVSDRVAVYATVRERWRDLDVDGKIALSGVGGFWFGVRDGWKSASYVRQQAWMHAAPLPPPMVATSLGYLEAVTMGDVTRHVRVLHDTLGPFHLTTGR